MSNYTELIERLYKHHEDYANGKTQDFLAVFSDCVHAADAIETLSRSIGTYAKSNEELIRRADSIARMRDIVDSRLRHLLESATICRYDALNPLTGEYSLDIETLDANMQRLERYIENEDSPEVCVATKAPSPDVLYICDMKKCGGNCSTECSHTRDIKHAKHFERVAADGGKVFFVEKEG